MAAGGIAIIYERIKRGKAFGTLVEVCPDSIFDKGSFAGDEADIWQSSLVHSRVQGNAKLRQSILENSSVGTMQGEGECEVVSSTLIRTECINGRILGSYLTDSAIHGAHVLIKNSVVEGCDVSGETIIENADVKGLILTGKMRLTGTWLRMPRHYLLKNAIADVGITESHDGRAFIGCREKNMTKWIQGKERFCRAAGWPIEFGNILHELFLTWLSEPA